jgi:hypothetical protein
MEKIQVRIRGQIDNSWSDWLGGLTVSHTTEGETVLTGTVRDQAALYALLYKLPILGLQLVSVNSLPQVEGHQNANPVET